MIHRNIVPSHYVYGQDIGVVCQGWEPCRYGCLAIRSSGEDGARRDSNGTGNVTSTHPVVCFSRRHFTYLFLRETERAKEMAQENLKLSGDQGLIFFYTHSTMILGVLADPDQIQEGVMYIRDMAGLEAAGAALLLPFIKSGWPRYLLAGKIKKKGLL